MLIQIGGAILTNTQNCERLFCSELQCNINRLIIILIDTDVLHDLSGCTSAELLLKALKLYAFSVNTRDHGHTHVT